MGRWPKVSWTCGPRLEASRATQRTTAYRVDKIPHAAHRRVLETLIQEQTSAKWEREDGEGGSLAWLGPKILLVRHVPQIQTEVADLLRQLQADAVEGKLVFESRDGPQARDWELKLYTFDSAEELQDFQAALSLVVRDPVQVTQVQKIGVQLAIEATPVGRGGPARTESTGWLDVPLLRSPRRSSADWGTTS